MVGHPALLARRGIHIVWLQGDRNTVRLREIFQLSRLVRIPSDIRLDHLFANTVASGPRLLMSRTPLQMLEPPERQHCQQQAAGLNCDEIRSVHGQRNGQIYRPNHDRARSETATDQEGIPPNIKIVDWDGPEDNLNPKNMRPGQKWLIVATLATGSACVTATSSIYTTTYEKMDAEFGNSRIVATLGLTLFVVGLGLSPMLLGPLSEFYGRRPIYIFAFILFTIWLVPCAVAQNIQTILIARFFNGISGAAFLSVAGGSIGDLFKKEDLQAPMTIYSASPFTGPCK